MNNHTFPIRTTRRLELIIFLFLLSTLLVIPLQATDSAKFTKALREANTLLDQGKAEEALAAVKAAGKLDTNRFEAPFLATVIYLELKKPELARLALNAALSLAPASKKAQLEALKQEVEDLEKSGVKIKVDGARPLELNEASNRRYGVLMLIIEEADKAPLDSERKKLLREFLIKSGPFLKDHPDQLQLWTVRAVASLELGERRAGWEAGKNLQRLGSQKASDPAFQKILAMLERRGWLVDNLPDLATLSVKELTPIAEGGDGPAQLALANANAKAGAEAEAIKWYLRAAEAGEKRAQIEIAWRQILGTDNLPQDIERGFSILKSLAAEGIDHAEYHLGDFFLKGVSKRGGTSKEHQNVVLGRELLARVIQKRSTDGLSASAAVILAMDAYSQTNHVDALHYHRIQKTMPYPEGSRRYGHDSMIMAWILATSPNPNARDGQEALKLALEFLAQMKNQPKELELDYLLAPAHSTVAAAHAEIGNFEIAIRFESEAKQLTIAEYKDRPNLIKFVTEKHDERLKLYKKKRPLRVNAEYPF